MATATNHVDETPNQVKEKKPQRAKTPRSPRIKIVVTQKEIDEALPRDSGHCMIADAVKVAYPTAKSISVDLQTIRWTDLAKGLRYTFLTPRVAQVALVKFDQGIAPEPMTFQLRKGQITTAGKYKKGKTRKADLRQDGSDTTVPRKIGGRTPPLAAHHGTRRAFGLRGLEL